MKGSEGSTTTALLALAGHAGGVGRALRVAGARSRSARRPIARGAAAGVLHDGGARAGAAALRGLRDHATRAGQRAALDRCAWIRALRRVRAAARAAAGGTVRGAGLTRSVRCAGHRGARADLPRHVACLALTPAGDVAADAVDALAARALARPGARGAGQVLSLLAEEFRAPETQSLSSVQLPRHALAPHTYGLQPCVWRAGQLPAPSQPAWSVATPALQLAPRQIVAAAGYAQAVALEPSQTPPQTLPSEAQAWRAPCGAPTTFVHVPAEPGTSHAWHCALQALVQHTPSTHWPLAH